MGFGGGGSGSFVLPNHDHTNVLADGGELLEATSLIDGITLKAWVDSAVAVSVAATAPTIQQSLMLVSFTTSSITYVDLTSCTLTMPAPTGKAIIEWQCSWYHSVAGAMLWRFVDDGVAQGDSQQYHWTGGGYWVTSQSTYCTVLNSQIVKIQVRQGGGTLTIGGGSYYSGIRSLEVR